MATGSGLCLRRGRIDDTVDAAARNLALAEIAVLDFQAPNVANAVRDAYGILVGGSFRTGYTPIVTWPGVRPPEGPLRCQALYAIEQAALTARRLPSGYPRLDLAIAHAERVYQAAVARAARRPWEVLLTAVTVILGTGLALFQAARKV